MLRIACALLVSIGLISGGTFAAHARSLAEACVDDSTANEGGLVACRSALLEGARNPTVYLRLAERLLHEAVGASDDQTESLLNEADRAVQGGIALVAEDDVLRKKLDITASSVHEQMVLWSKRANETEAAAVQNPRLLSLRCTHRRDQGGLRACNQLLALDGSDFAAANLPRSEVHAQTIRLALELNRCSDAIRTLGEAVASDPGNPELQELRRRISIVLDERTGTYECRFTEKSTR